MDQELFITTVKRTVVEPKPQKKHHHPCFEILCVFEGHTHVMIRDRRVVAGPGDLLIYYPYEDHEETVQAGEFSIVWMRFSGDNESLRESFPERDSTEPVIHLPWPERFHSLFSQMILEHQLKDPWSEVMMSGYLRIFVALLQRSIHWMQTADVSTSRISKAVELIHRSLETDVSLRDLAAETCMSESHFSHTFKELIGTSPKQYLIQAKLLKAKELLLTTELNIQDIAAKIGYDDRHYFSKVFRRSTGVTPSVFRKNSRN